MNCAQHVQKHPKRHPVGSGEKPGGMEYMREHTDTWILLNPDIRDEMKRGNRGIHQPRDQQQLLNHKGGILISYNNLCPRFSSVALTAGVLARSFHHADLELVRFVIVRLQLGLRHGIITNANEAAGLQDRTKHRVAFHEQCRPVCESLRWSCRRAVTKRKIKIGAHISNCRAAKDTTGRAQHHTLARP